MRKTLKKAIATGISKCLQDLSEADQRMLDRALQDLMDPSTHMRRAMQRFFPTAAEIDDEDEGAAKRMIHAIVAAAFRIPQI